MRPGRTHPSNFALDRLARGVLAGLAKSKPETHLATCPWCRERHRALELDRASFVPDAALLVRLAPGPLHHDISAVEDDSAPPVLRRRRANSQPTGKQRRYGGSTPNRGGSS